MRGRRLYAGQFDHRESRNDGIMCIHSNSTCLIYRSDATLSRLKKNEMRSICTVEPHVRACENKSAHFIKSLSILHLLVRQTRFLNNALTI